MRVKCIEIVDSRNRPAFGSPWLKLEAEYVVLSVAAHSKRPVELLLHHGGDDIGWWSAQSFVTVADNIPANWTAVADHRGCSIGPGTWARDGFWERYFGGDKDAAVAFRTELAIMVKEANRGR